MKFEIYPDYVTYTSRDEHTSLYKISKAGSNTYTLNKVQEPDKVHILTIV